MQFLSATISNGLKQFVCERSVQSLSKSRKGDFYFFIFYCQQTDRLKQFVCLFFFFGCHGETSEELQTMLMEDSNWSTYYEQPVCLDIHFFTRIACSFFLMQTVMTSRLSKCS